MELVGIVLWPIIGLVYIAYKLLKEDPDLRHRVFSKDTLVTLASLALVFVPIYVIGWLSEVTVPKSELGIRIHSAIFVGMIVLYMLLMIFALFIYPTEWFQYWLQWHLPGRKRNERHGKNNETDVRRQDK